MFEYFIARRAETAFTNYRELVLKYWHAQPEDTRTWMSDDAPAPENAESLLLRQEVLKNFPEVDHCATDLGINVYLQSFPAPAIGGAVIPVNVLYSAINRDM